MPPIFADEDYSVIVFVSINLLELLKEKGIRTWGGWGGGHSSGVYLVYSILKKAHLLDNHGAI